MPTCCEEPSRSAVTKQPALLRVLAHTLTSKAVQENHTLRNSGYSIYCTALLFFFSLLLDPRSPRPRCLKKPKTHRLVMSRLLPLAHVLAPFSGGYSIRHGPPPRQGDLCPPISLPFSPPPARLFPRSATPSPSPEMAPPQSRKSHQISTRSLPTPRRSNNERPIRLSTRGSGVSVSSKKVKKGWEMRHDSTYTATCGQLRV